MAQGKVRTRTRMRTGTAAALLPVLQLMGGFYTPTEGTGVSRPSSFPPRWAPFQPMHWMMGSGPRASFLL